MKLVLDNGKEITLSEELVNTIMKEIKLRNFVTEVGLEHWYVEYDSNTQYDPDATEIDIEAFNAFTNKEYAQKVAFKQLLERKLLAFKDEYDKELDWNDYEKQKYSLQYAKRSKEVVVSDNYYVKRQGSIYFSSKKIAEKCIEMYKDDLIKYFEMNIW